MRGKKARAIRRAYGVKHVRHAFRNPHHVDHSSNFRPTGKVPVFNLADMLKVTRGELFRRSQREE